MGIPEGEDPQVIYESFRVALNYYASVYRSFLRNLPKKDDASNLTEHLELLDRFDDLLADTHQYLKFIKEGSKDEHPKPG